ncbi:MAG: Rne/Rng family ribonuclease [Candidatus Nanopelagicales bacterium]|nr:Rne/Rng family ribonuclease [Candidatus Nanopelagicales bacterium]
MREAHRWTREGTVMVDEHAQDAAEAATAAAAEQDGGGEHAAAPEPSAPEPQLGSPSEPEPEPGSEPEDPTPQPGHGEQPEHREASVRTARRRRSASRPAGPPAHQEPEVAMPPAAAEPQQDEAGDTEATTPDEAIAEDLDAAGAPEPDTASVPVRSEPVEAVHPEPVHPEPVHPEPVHPEPVRAEPPTGRRPRRATRGVTTVAFSGTAVPEPPVVATPPAEVPAVALFQPPDETRAARVRRRDRAGQAAGPDREATGEPRADGATTEPGGADAAEDGATAAGGADATAAASDVAAPGADVASVDAGAAGGSADAEETPAVDAEDDDDSGPRRRRRRGGRRRRRGQGGAEGEQADADVDGGDEGEAPEDRGAEGVVAAGAPPADAEGARAEGAEAEPAEADEAVEEGGGSRRRRRRRRRAGVAEEMEDLSDETATVVKVREGRRSATDEITGVRGSTRIEAKRQRRRDGREAGRRRAPILTEAEFLARRESVNRVMCVREHGDRVQIAVLEDGVLVEHYVNRADSSSMVGNVYLGKVQNVLPSMEAAFVDVGRGRNAVLYAGEVNWDAAGLEGQPKRIELALKSGDPVLVQVTKDPMGHKGARLTSQISLPGRFLVFVPEGSMTGISRKLPDTERARLKGILKDVVPEGAGVIVRTAAEGATEEQLTADVTRLTAQWAEIQKKAKSASPPSLLYGEPDLVIKVVRDIFNEDFTSMVVQGASTWQTLHDYVSWVAPDLLPKVSQWTEDTDLYAADRIDEQLAKALDRKVWLPSGGSLVIDRTEAMTVIDVNTGKFTGQGGNLEETVTRNNLEAAEEIVRQLRLRDIGGIIVVDFIDMVLESNRDLVLRRLVECLGRDRTKHQVAEVTSLGLVQMTRKRIGQGLLEVFSTPCEQCGGRGHLVQTEPVGDVEEPGGARRDRDRGGRRGRQGTSVPVHLGGKQTGKVPPPPKFDEHGHIDHSGEAEGPESEGEPVGAALVEAVLVDLALADAPVPVEEAAADEAAPVEAAPVEEAPDDAAADEAAPVEEAPDEAVVPAGEHHEAGERQHDEEAGPEPVEEAPDDAAADPDDAPVEVLEEADAPQGAV